jgi:hypothetical protein
MNKSYEDEIRQDAYYKWVAAGKPEGQSEKFWYEAEQESSLRHLKYLKDMYSTNIIFAYWWECYNGEVIQFLQEKDCIENGMIVKLKAAIECDALTFAVLNPNTVSDDVWDYGISMIMDYIYTYLETPYVQRKSA